MNAPTKIVIDRSGCPVEETIQCAEAIRAAKWWQTLGIAERWPLTTDEAERMLRDAGQFDLEDGQLAELIERRIVPTPAAHDELSASDILEIAHELETRRQWKRSPSAHDHKRSVQELLIEKALQEDSLEELRASVSDFDIRRLMGALVTSESRDLRLHCVALLGLLLEVDHGVKV